MLIQVAPVGDRAVIALAAWSGMRWGEVVGLPRRLVDLDARKVRVEQGLSRQGGRYVLGPLKTSASRRTISLSAEVAMALRVHMGQRGGGSDDLVFTGKRGAYLRGSNWRARVWLPTVDAAGFAGLRFHDLRHTHAAWMIAAGEHPKVISSRLGHSSVATTLDRYGHLMEGLAEGTADRLTVWASQASSDAPADQMLTVGV